MLLFQYVSILFMCSWNAMLIHSLIIDS